MTALQVGAGAAPCELCCVLQREGEWKAVEKDFAVQVLLEHDFWALPVLLKKKMNGVKA